MPNYLTMYDPSDMLNAIDLQGREVHLEIEAVAAGELTGQKGRKAKKPIVKFKGKEKKFALNKTNGKAIARMYGKETDAWIGKWITLYTTTTEYDGDTIECIRVRPVAPNVKAAS